MRRLRRCLLVAIVGGLFLLQPGSMAAGTVRAQIKASPKPTPLQDDANLHDVQFVGSKIGWVVGDHGVIWNTADGGRTWRLVPSPVDCALRSVCFLTDRVGWIVGGGTAPFTRIGYGVVLFTSDGGATWQQLTQVGSRKSEVGRSKIEDRGSIGVSNPQSNSRLPTSDFRPASLPRLHYVKFFGMRQGVAVGGTSSEHPSGVFRTTDGGKTWLSVPGKHNAGWRTADFVTAEVGTVAGEQGRVSMVGGGRLLPPTIEPMGLRGLRDVTLASNLTGWLVGDGGLVLRTENGGVAWSEPATPLPNQLRDMVDFRAVAARDRKVWVAGQPGSVIWHTADAGRTWERQFTRHTVPINALCFTSDTNGWAVGSLGGMLRTDDGGETWQAVRGGGRRVALLAVHTRAERVAFPLLAKQSLELGYRSLVLLPARRDIGPDGHGNLNLDLRLDDAVTTAGGSGSEVDWRFPIAIPGLDRDAEKLVADWNRRTEYRLRDVILGKLVCQLRCWRPSVVVIDEPAADDAAAHVLNDALMSAVRQAADSTQFVQHQQLTGLGPWQVERVFRRLPAGSTGQVHVDLHHYLPRVGMSVQHAAAEARSRVFSIPQITERREAYRLVLDATASKQEKPAKTDFFLGIPMSPGSQARRQLAAIDETRYQLGQKIVRRQRDFREIAKRYLDDDRHAGQIIAQLKQIGRGMPDAQAALQLLQLSNDYRRRSRWDLVEATLVELVEQYPDEAPSHEAMRWLLQFWTGAEPVWQRARLVQVNRQQLSLNKDSIQNRVEQAEAASRIKPLQRDGSLLDLGPDPRELLNVSGQLRINGDADWRSGAVRNWHRQAVRMASLIRRKAPAFYRSPEVRFPLASLSRQMGAHRLADRFYRQYDRAGTGDPWKTTAESELWLLNPTSLPPKPMAVCRFTTDPPWLDGVLSDTCWQQANAIRLRTSSQERENAPQNALVMLSYDSKYLYLAVSVPRVPDTPDDRPELPGRTHDADLSKFDRVSLYLDIDRDYATYYTFSIDQRGWTADACWEDTSWNPKWHVAADADRTHWRIEAAIPLSELAPVAPTRESVWAVGIVRTIPAVGVQSWTLPAASRPRPELFGLLRFQ